MRQELARLLLAQRGREAGNAQPVDVAGGHRSCTPRRAGSVEHVAQGRVHRKLPVARISVAQPSAGGLECAKLVLTGCIQVKEASPALTLRQERLVQLRQPAAVLRPVAARRHVIAKRVVVVLVMPVATGLLDGLVQPVVGIDLPVFSLHTPDATPAAARPRPRGCVR